MRAVRGDKREAIDKRERVRVLFAYERDSGIN